MGHSGVDRAAGGRALPAGTDPAVLTRYLNQVHDDFVQTGQVDRALRPVVVDSWRRSLVLGLDPEYSRPRIRLADDQLAEIRAAHPLAPAMPLIRRLLVESAAEAGLLVAVSDAAGQLLWVEGDHDLRTRAEAMAFRPGADWSEASAGTNAPGTALVLGRPVQFLGPEHLVRPVTPWSCSAAPIREPDTGAVLGVLDLTGGPEVASAQTMALVRATVAAVEAELRLERLRPAGPPARSRRPDVPRLRALGGRGVEVRYGQTVTTLSLRHSEMAVLLAVRPEGYTANELAVALSEQEHSPVTIRAELTRLRAALGPIGLRSRPYAIATPVALDIRDVRAELDRGDVRRAVARYRGPILPLSESPAIGQLRVDLHQALRSRLIAAGDADALLAFADTAHGHDDFEIWRAAYAALPATSPRRTEVEAHLAGLDAALA
jgi:hypothetical protein